MDDAKASQPAGGSARAAGGASARSARRDKAVAPSSRTTPRGGVLEDPATQLRYRLARVAKEECAALDAPSQARPPRDGVLRPGTSADGLEDGRVIALLPRTGAEHHASALLVVPHHHHSNATPRARQPPGYALLCAWFSGVEGAEVVSIHVARLAPTAHRWDAPQRVAAVPGASLQNPVWLLDEPAPGGAEHRRSNSTLRLLFTKQFGMEQGTSNVMEVVSQDGGRSWSAEPRMVMAEPGAFIKNAALAAQPRADEAGRGPGGAGEWLLPMYHTPEGANKFPSQYSELRRSVDGGKSWQHASRMSKLGEGLVQPSVVRLPSGQLVAFFRQRYSNETHRARSCCTAGPSCWCSTTTGGHAVKALKENGKKTVLDSKFHPVSVGLSFDGGHTWPYVRDLEEDFHAKHEYSYPSVVQSPDGLVHITYTWSQDPCRRCAIRYHRISEEWVKGSWAWGSTKGVYQPPGEARSGAGAWRVEQLLAPLGALVVLVGMAVSFWGWHCMAAGRGK
eukprot:jgi/Tetstr1/434172/TSEL_023283.t1